MFGHLVPKNVDYIASESKKVPISRFVGVKNLLANYFIVGSFTTINNALKSANLF